MDWLAMTLGASGGGAFLWVLKKIPNDKICAVVEGCFEKLGILMTAGLTKFWATKKLWNKTIEPYVVDAIDNIVSHGIQEFVRGLRSDN